MGDSNFPPPDFWHLQNASGLVTQLERHLHSSVCLAWTAITCDCLRRPAGTGIAVYFEMRAARWAPVPNSSAQKSQW